jgi:outer membrane protein OmpA-like peptidoglycan-associated protein
VKARFIITALFALSLSLSGYGQSTEPVTYYVTIGVFGVHQNAINFTDKANKRNFTAQYAINPKRNLYYVYLLSTQNKKEAFAYLINLRADTPYKECWVFIGMLGEEIVAKEPAKPKEKSHEEKLMEQRAKEDSMRNSIAKAKMDSAAIATKVDSAKVAKPVVETPIITKPVVKPSGKPFYFKLVSVETGNEIIGEVHLQESTKAQQYQAFRGNEVVYIKAPANKAGTYTVITQVPGYQQIKIGLAYKDPGGATGPEDEVIVPLELKQAARGDYIDFNNVKFIRNSSIMDPGSQSELDGLASLMKDKPSYKIKIHGHVNGKQSREITTIGTSPRFFEVDPVNNKKLTTSAKVLSDERANAVKGYLVSQGISGERIVTKAEGGKIPLYPETSTLAGYNDRVEIEVKKN